MGRRQKPSAPSWYVKNDAQPQSPDTSPPPSECPEGSVSPRRLSGPPPERRVTDEVALFETINWLTAFVKNNPGNIFLMPGDLSCVPVLVVGCKWQQLGDWT